jgi:hypothetical protein
MSCSTNGRETDSKENFNKQPNTATEHGAPTVKMMDQHTLQEDGTDKAWPKP